MPTISVNIADGLMLGDAYSEAPFSHDAFITETISFGDSYSALPHGYGAYSRYVNPYVEYKDYNAHPYARGALYFYDAFTDLVLATFADVNSTIVNPNPIILDEHGSPGSVFLSPGSNYKAILNDVNGNQIWMREWINPFSAAPVSPPPPPPPPGPTPCQIANVLDGLSISPTTAFSSRKLRSAYAGASMRVQRTSDNAQADIGFGADCSLDTTALLAFCAGTNCVIAKWYDQSGNGNDVIASAGGSNGPVVVLGGALAATISGKIANTTGSTFLFNSVGGIIGTAAGTINAIGSATSGGATSSIASWWRIPAIVSFASSDNNGLAAGIAFGQTGTAWSPPAMIADRYVGDWLGAHTDMNVSVPYTFGTFGIFLFRYNTSDLTATKGYIGGGTPITDSNTTANAAAVNMAIGNSGNLGNSPSQFQGIIGEVITFNAELPIADTNILGSNQSTYWGLSWSNIST